MAKPDIGMKYRDIVRAVMPSDLQGELGGAEAFWAQPQVAKYYASKIRGSIYKDRKDVKKFLSRLDLASVKDIPVVGLKAGTLARKGLSGAKELVFHEYIHGVQDYGGFDIPEYLRSTKFGFHSGLANLIRNNPSYQGIDKSRFVQEYVSYALAQGKNWGSVFNEVGRAPLINELKKIPAYDGMFGKSGALSISGMKDIISRGVFRGSSGLNRNIMKSITLKGITGFGKKGLIATALAGSLLFSGTGFAQNVVPTGSGHSITYRSDKLRRLTTYIAARTEKTHKGIRKISDLLYETAIHESARLRYGRQLHDGTQSGIARSIFMVEPTTADNLVEWAKQKPKAMHLLTTTSGRSANNLSKMTRAQLADLLSSNDKFAAAMARVKYLSIKKSVPNTFWGRATYWSKYYQGTSNPIKTAQYVNNNRIMAREVAAAKLAETSFWKSVPPKPTQGLVNNVLHNGKTKHAIKSVAKKLSTLHK